MSKMSSSRVAKKFADKGILSDTFIAVLTQRHVAIQLLPSILYWHGQGAIVYIAAAPLQDNARNIAVDEFLKSSCKYLFFIDDDMEPHFDTIKDLKLCDKDVVGAYHSIIQGRNEDFAYMIHGNAFTESIPNPSGPGFYTKHVTPKMGLVPVIGVSTASMLIKRHVLEKMPRPWFYFDWNKDHTAHTGEDYVFCREAGKMGFEVFCATDIIVGHIKSLRI